MTDQNGTAARGNTDVILDLADDIADLVRGMITEIRPRLIQAALTGRRGENENTRHSDNFLSDHDLWMHERYKELLIRRIPSFVYASEEADAEVIGPDTDPDLVVLVDPLDTSELAVRGLYGYTHVLVYSRVRARPIIAVVGDIFHHIQIYSAALDDTGTDQAWMVTADGARHRLERPSPASLSEALVTNYLMRPGQRFQPLARQQQLLTALSAESEDGKARGRIGVDFGSIGLCHVAAGFTDAMVEFAKGFAIWDLSPGHYILHAAGGVVTDLHGEPIPLDYNLDTMTEINQAMNKRKKFIAAGNIDLAEEIRAQLQE
ncbi:inositol monophosphatase family protein [Nocardia shimofusensis]|uniref:inositol monophosphatase family protein n=1 Tax=Nocardia shimofusensis TaxID=228596 RepID=UPI00082C2C7C|nr:inositol monophosphatase family protein [Nocardia shimofusensis]